MCGSGVDCGVWRVKKNQPAHAPGASSPVRMIHSVTMIGRGHFLVASRSRAEVSHVVDLEPNEYGPAPACSCEQNRFRGKVCAHLVAVMGMEGRAA